MVVDMSSERDDEERVIYEKGMTGNRGDEQGAICWAWWGTEISELCAHFSQYVSPAYHHDRSERCVQMRLYSMKKSEFLLVYSLFFAFLFLATVIGFSGPEISDSNERTVWLAAGNKSHSLYDNFTLKIGGIAGSELSRYNRQLTIYAILHTQNTDDEAYADKMRVTVRVNGVRLHSSNSQPRELSSAVGENMVGGYVRCLGRDCEPLPLARLLFVRYERYHLFVHFHTLFNFHRKYSLDTITFQWVTYNADFTRMQISFRLIFLLATFFVTVWLANGLRKYRMNDWSYEQKWIMILLPLLLLYNGPMYGSGFVVDSWLLDIMQNSMQMLFLGALCLFWICAYHALRQNERTWWGFYADKVTLVMALTLPLLFLLYFDRLQSPHLPPQRPATYTVLWRCWLLFLLLYVLYLLGCVLKSYTQLRTLPFFNKRLRMLSSSLLLINLLLAWTILCWPTVYAPLDFLQHQLAATPVRSTGSFPSFSASASSTSSPPSSVHFMFFYSYLNFYFYLMAYIYSPPSRHSLFSTTNVFEDCVTKDNPTFSMINEDEYDDEEDDDDEEGRKLVSRVHVSAGSQLLSQRRLQQSDANAVTSALRPCQPHTDDESD